MATRNYVLREFVCSFYYKNQWVYGTLQLCVSGLKFIPKDYRRHGVHVSIEYRDISIAKKTRTGIIFNAILIMTAKCNSKEYWFSSFYDRETIFNLILHFWKFYLLYSPASDSSGIKSDTTPAGHELLQIVNDSERTLAASAMSLATQGDQIDDAINKMGGIHHNLDISRRLLYGMEGWINKWSKYGIRKNTKTVDSTERKHSMLDAIPDLDIVYCAKHGCEDSQWLPGTMVLDDKGLAINDKGIDQVCRYNWIDISKLKILSPWELTVIQYKIGQPDIQYGVMGTRLIEVIQLLEQRIKSKIEYCEPSDSSQIQGEFVSSESSSYHPIDRESSCRTSPSSRTTVCEDENDIEAFPEVSIQKQRRMERAVISDREIDDISLALDNLKSVAVKLGEEQDRQNDAIDELTATVDKANVRLTEQQIFMKKL